MLGEMQTAADSRSKVHNPGYLTKVTQDVKVRSSDRNQQEHLGFLRGSSERRERRRRKGRGGGGEKLGGGGGGGRGDEAGAGGAMVNKRRQKSSSSGEQKEKLQVSEGNISHGVDTSRRHSVCDDITLPGPKINGRPATCG